MRETPCEIERLLRHHGFVYQANLAGIAAATYTRSPREAYPVLLSDEWWGDRGSIAAVDLAVAGGFTPEARRDGQALRAALVAVFGELREVVDTDEHTALIARHFHKWSVSGM